MVDIMGRLAEGALQETNGQVQCCRDSSFYRIMRVLKKGSNKATTPLFKQLKGRLKWISSMVSSTTFADWDWG
jgi:hypothetical protein